MKIFLICSKSNGLFIKFSNPASLGKFDMYTRRGLYDNDNNFFARSTPFSLGILLSRNTNSKTDNCKVSQASAPSLHKVTSV